MPCGITSAGTGLKMSTLMVIFVSERIANLVPSIISTSCLPPAHTCIEVDGPVPNGMKTFPTSDPTRPTNLNSPSRDVSLLILDLKAALSPLDEIGFELHEVLTC